MASELGSPQRFFHMPRFQHQAPRQVFYKRPDFAQQQAMQQLTFDGKRMRKAVNRKTIDYNPSVIRYLENRLWQRDHRDQRAIQPDAACYNDLVPPLGMLRNPMNAVTTKFVRTSTNKVKCPVFVIRWTPEGRRLVTGASSGEFTLWNGLTFNFETILQAHDSSVRAMTWSHNDMWMLTADNNGYVKYWQSNMNNVKMFQAHKEAIREASFSPTDNKFATCSDDGTVRIWDFLRCHEERILRGHGADVKCVDWHPTKGLVVSGSKDSQQPIKFWDPKTGQSLATLHAHKNTVMEVKWNLNGNWLLTASRDHLCKLYDLRNLKEELQVFRGHKKEATAVAWHPVHEGLFASGGSDGSLLFWHTGVEKEVGGMEMAHEGMIWSLAWHPLGHILCSGSNDHTSKFWTRNRPGDKMRDRYNLNLLPGMSEDGLEYDDLEPNSIASIPGMGLPEQLKAALEQEQNKEASPDMEMSIPGLDWGMDEVMSKDSKKVPQKKVPYAKPIPAQFQQAWAENKVPLAPPSDLGPDRKLDPAQTQKRTQAEIEQDMASLQYTNPQLLQMKMNPDMGPPPGPGGPGGPGGPMGQFPGGPGPGGPPPQGFNPNMGPGGPPFMGPGQMGPPDMQRHPGPPRNMGPQGPHGMGPPRGMMGPPPRGMGPHDPQMGPNMMGPPRNHGPNNFMQGPPGNMGPQGPFMHQGQNSGPMMHGMGPQGPQGPQGPMGPNKDPRGPGLHMGPQEQYWDQDYDPAQDTWRPQGFGGRGHRGNGGNWGPENFGEFRGRGFRGGPRGGRGGGGGYQDDFGAPDDSSDDMNRGWDSGRGRGRGGGLNRGAGHEGFQGPMMDSPGGRSGSLQGMDMASLPPRKRPWQDGPGTDPMEGPDGGRPRDDGGFGPPPGRGRGWGPRSRGGPPMRGPPRGRGR
ncbi:pre-mRNA 3' end processing protein WDR33 isoform X2 [Periophthalmus magnuspinnatus]|uniref:pre-mRNA 3' end processing protein WDR33 isoform X2 n=1 Tax=Periophthalmus magnuspinnatus TaxID=409849 RepID=UPI00145B21B7|nr:pre-mRNA 3' end processing protein WDR33 isoform X2 [Periophthalmus magnuspinnatus]